MIFVRLKPNMITVFLTEVDVYLVILAENTTPIKWRHKIWTLNSLQNYITITEIKLI